MESNIVNIVEDFKYILRNYNMQIASRRKCFNDFEGLVDDMLASRGEKKLSMTYTKKDVESAKAAVRRAFGGRASYKPEIKTLCGKITQLLLGNEQPAKHYNKSTA